MRRFTVSLAGLSLWPCMGAHGDRTTATPTRGVGTGAGVRWVPAALTLGAGTGTGNGWASVIPTGETDTGAGTSGAPDTLTQGTGAGPGKRRSTAALGQRQTEEQKQPLHSPKHVYLHRQSLRKPVGSNTGMKQCQKQSLGMQHEQFPQRLAPKHSEQVRTHMGVGDKTRPDQTAPRHPVQVS